MGSDPAFCPLAKADSLPIDSLNISTYMKKLYIIPSVEQCFAAPTSLCSISNQYGPNSDIIPVNPNDGGEDTPAPPPSGSPSFWEE